MSIFASQTQSPPIPIPFDPPHTVTVRKLTARELEAAQEAHRGSIASGSPRSWAVMFRRALEHGASDPDVLKAIHDPLTGFDRFKVVSAGLLAWTYPQLIAVPDEEDDTGVRAVTEANRQKAIDDLDDEAVDFIATAIMRLTKPGLFNAEGPAAEQKKDSGPSTEA